MFKQAGVVFRNPQVFFSSFSMAPPEGATLWMVVDDRVLVPWPKFSLEEVPLFLAGAIRFPNLDLLPNFPLIPMDEDDEEAVTIATQEELFSGGAELNPILPVHDGYGGARGTGGGYLQSVDRQHRNQEVYSTKVAGKCCHSGAGPAGRVAVHGYP